MGSFPEILIDPKFLGPDLQVYVLVRGILCYAVDVMQVDLAFWVNWRKRHFFYYYQKFSVIDFFRVQINKASLELNLVFNSEADG